MPLPSPRCLLFPDRSNRGADRDIHPGVVPPCDPRVVVWSRMKRLLLHLADS